MGIGTFGGAARLNKRRIVTGQSARLAAIGSRELTLTNLKTNGLYWVKPSKTAPAVQVYCDMQTDKGGWMLFARTHPGGSAASWGWQGTGAGTWNDFNNAYQLNWYTAWHNQGGKFTEFLMGNRKNIGTNEWGPFIYKRSLGPNQYNGTNESPRVGYDRLITTNDTVIPAMTLIKSNMSVYNTTSFPWMQSHLGETIDSTAAGIFHMRDMRGASAGGYGIVPGGMNTTYINDMGEGRWAIAGPWGAGETTQPNGDFDQDIAGSDFYGGTRQCMLMVR